ncbi:MAG: hypothetical protein GC204_18385 [Chloroflexi bacterium]|nr:hypothetical protein [Chloroflexota bacterium]
MSSLNAEIKAAIDASDVNRARQLLRDALKEADAETYYLASQVAVDDEQRREFLEKAVELDPFHGGARTALKQSGNSAKLFSVANPRTQTITDPNVSAKPAHAAEPPQVAAKASDKGEPELILPVAQIKEDGIIYTIPHSRGTVRTQLPIGTTVEVLERDAQSNWINVTFVNSVGQRAFGWIPRSKLGEITFRGQPATVSDLKISELEFNSKSEVTELGSKLSVPTNIYVGVFDLAIFIGLPLLGLTVAGIGDIRHVGIGIILLFAVDVVFLWAVRWSINYAKKKRSVPMCAFNGANIRSAKRAKMSTTELVLEQQQKALLLGIAGNMATRLIPNNQNITVRQR